MRSCHVSHASQHLFSQRDPIRRCRTPCIRYTFVPIHSKIEWPAALSFCQSWKYLFRFKDSHQYFTGSCVWLTAETCVIAHCRDFACKVMPSWKGWSAWFFVMKTCSPFWKMISYPKDKWLHAGLTAGLLTTLRFYSKKYHNLSNNTTADLDSILSCHWLMMSKPFAFR